MDFLSDKIRQPLEKCRLDGSLATHSFLVQFSLHTGLGGYFVFSGQEKRESDLV